jgi:hypothetical protein
MSYVRIPERQEVGSFITISCRFATQSCLMKRRHLDPFGNKGRSRLLIPGRSLGSYAAVKGPELLPLHSITLPPPGSFAYLGYWVCGLFVQLTALSCLQCLGFLARVSPATPRKETAATTIADHLPRPLKNSLRFCESPPLPEFAAPGPTSSFFMRSTSPSSSTISSRVIRSPSNKSHAAATAARDAGPHHHNGGPAHGPWNACRRLKPMLLALVYILSLPPLG